MKYHATLSTIVISIIVLLLFTSVAVFTVFSLNILSPGYMISDYLLSKIPSLEPYQLSYDKITNLNNGLTVQNIDISYQDEHLLHLDNVKVSASVFQLIKGYLKKDMNLDVRLQGLDIDIPFDYKELKKPVILEKVRDRENVDIKEDKPLSLKLKISSDDANIKYLDLFDLSGLTFNLSIEPGFKISDIQLQLDKFSANYNGIKAEGDDFRLDLKNNKLSSIVLSVDHLFIQDKFNLDLTSLRLSTKIKDFKNIDYLNLPLNLSIKTIGLDYNDLILNSNDISASYQDEVASFYFGTLNCNYNDYFVNTESLPISIALNEDELSFASKSSLFLGIKDKPLISIGDVRALISKRNDEILVMINQFDAQGVGVKENICSYLEKATVGNVNMVAKITPHEKVELDGSIDIGLDTSFESIKNINIPLSISTKLDKDFKIESASIYSLKTHLFEGDDIKFSFSLSSYDSYSFSLQKGKVLKLSGSLDDSLAFRFEATNYKLSPYNELIETFVPALKSYIGDGTSLTSVIDFNYNRNNKEGDCNSLLTLSDIRFNDNEFSLSTNLDSHISSSIVDLKRLVLTSSFLRAEYRGLIDIDTFKPQGVLTLSLPDSVTPILELSFFPEGYNSYSYTGIIPYFKTGSVAGHVTYAEDGFNTLFNLNFTNRTYPFNLDWNFAKKTISIDSNGLIANIDYKDLLLDIIVSANGFPVGRKTDKPDTVINGNFNFIFDIPNQQFNVSLPSLTVGKFYMLENNPSLHISLLGDNNGITLKQFDFISPVDSFRGYGKYSLSDKQGAFTMGNDSESIDITFSPFEQYYTGIVDVKNLSLSPFSLPEQRLNVTLIGRGKDLNNFEFSGNLRIDSEEGGANPWDLKSSILINKDELSLSNVEYNKGKIKLYDSSLLLDIGRGKYEVNSKLNLTFDNLEGPKQIITESKLTAELGAFDSWFTAVNDVASRYQEGNIALSLAIPYLIMDNEIVATEKVINISKDKNIISLSGNTLSGAIDIDNFKGNLDIFGLENIIKAQIGGIFNPSSMNLDVNIDKFNLYYLNTFFPSPVFKFLPDSNTYGSIKVLGNLLENDFHLFGDVSAYQIGMDVWWVRRQDIYLNHPTFHIWDNIITSASLPVLTVDRETREKKTHTGTLELSMQNSFLDYFNLDIYTNENNMVYVRVPILNSNVDIDFWTYGHFKFSINELGRITLSGDLSLNNGQISLGLNPLPPWWTHGRAVINDFNFTIGKNVRFIFPLSSSPILSADLKGDTSFSFYSNMFTNQLSIGGEILIKSGQIYYFSKNFFITEGAIELNETNGKLNPKISLRARLRDFDANNEKIDIYLVLNNSTLDNINPSFESSPQKSNNEIMAILGNAILPSDGGVGNMNTVASLLTSSVDILSRLGIMMNQSGDLNQSIKKALNLDMFTLNSQIIENFLIDSVTTNTNNNTSALSRYLNNTSIYLGKNLNDNFFLQGIIHFASVNNSDSATFFASDLAINTELSLEWNNPLGTVTFFTHPDSLTLYDTVRKFGFTYTKRLTF